MRHTRAWAAAVVVAAALAAISAPALAETRFVFANESPYDATFPSATPSAAASPCCAPSTASR